MIEKCHICNSYEIKHYRQIRKDGVAVVTARCENGHIPIKGKPFYPVYLFDVGKLPLLPSQINDAQTDMFVVEPKQIKTVEQPIKKYPPMPKPKTTGVNFPIPVEEK